jgi:hypothetical protein
MSLKQKKNKPNSNKTKKNNIIQDAIQNVVQFQPIEVQTPNLYTGEREEDEFQDCKPDSNGKRPRCKKARCDLNPQSSTFNKCVPKLFIQLNGLTLVVVQRKNKDYGESLVSTLNANIEHVKELKKQKDKELKKQIVELEKELKNNNSDFKAKYGDLGDELVIQVALLQNELNKITNQESAEETEQIDEPVEEEKEEDITPEDNAENQQINNEVEQEIEEDNQPVEEEKLDENIIADIQNNEPYPDLDIELTAQEKELQDKIYSQPDKESKEYNDFLFDKEKIENQNIQLQPESNDLYPLLDDSNFNIKIAQHQEFNETKFDGEIKDIKETAEAFCNKEFELMPHQIFVKNFLSLETPYNSLLLYHGLGTGKTCSAIGIAEEMRNYMKQVQINQRIMIIASPNVQNNFRLQLFDDRKLKFENGVWNLNTCVGNSLLSEINPSRTLDLSREKIISQINQLINQYYIFMGYRELGNFIKKKIQVPSDGLTIEQQKNMELQKIKQTFNNRLIIVDEIHNLRILQDNKESKKTATLLMQICQKAENTRLLMLSATPMYNSYKEIIWLTNLLNTVDNRSTIKEEQVFNKDGEFREPDFENNIESGEELLSRKLTGYVSFIRGENPYSFPFRVYPDEFDKERVLDTTNYYKTQLNKKEIENPIENLPVYMNTIGDYQNKVYKQIINNFQIKSESLPVSESMKNIPTFENMESFGYVLLKEPLESLNIVFPNDKFDALEDNTQADEKLLSSMVGKSGLSRIMTYETAYKPNELRYDYEYKPEIKEKYGRIFHLDQLQKYSSKIHQICNVIKNSKGPIIIYSFYIDGGVVPIALALEEMGFTRYGSASYTKPLFKNTDTKPIDALTMKTKDELLKDNAKATFKQAKYVMITGDKKYSPNNLEDVKYVTNPNNKYGEDVKVILITKAAAEGIDFKFIRQIHILDPWYNLNRLEQIIGRGVRNLSHCGLPFEERNVEIYLHGTKTEEEDEPADMYVYRFAEKKSKLIGKVSRVMKETSVDCLLNIEQTNFTVDKLVSFAANKDIEISLASNIKIPFKIGDKPFSNVCDYMENCEYKCKPDATITEDDINYNNYSNNFAKMNYASIVKRVRQLFREQSFYRKDELMRLIKIKNSYPDEHIYFALSIFVENKKDHLVDKYGRSGYLINADEYYAFQPNEINDQNLSIYERSTPLDYKQEKLLLQLPEKVTELKTDNNKTQQIQEINEQKQTISSQPIEDESTKIEKKYKLIEDKLKSKANTINIQKGKNLKIREHLRTKEDLESRLINLTSEEEAQLKRIKKELVNTTHYNSNELDNKGFESLALKTAEKDWYIHYGRVHYLLKNNHFINETLLEKYFVEHFIETLPFEEKLFLLNYFHSKIINIDENDSIIKHFKSYFHDNVLDNGIQQGFLLTDITDKKEDLFIFVKKYQDTFWVEGEPLDAKGFEETIVTNYQYNKSTLGKVVGFNEYDNKEKAVVYKLKALDIKSKNNKGAKISILGKSEILKKLNILLDEYPYVENKDYKRKYTDNEIADIFKPGLCVIVEILSRFYNDANTNKNYFLTQEKALISKIKNM